MEDAERSARELRSEKLNVSHCPREQSVSMANTSDRFTFIMKLVFDGTEYKKLKLFESL